jgi:hypothetical protein
MVNNVVVNGNGWNKIKKIYLKLSSREIREVGQLSRIIMSIKIEDSKG